MPLRLLVGQDFKGNSVLYVPEQFERYIYASAGAEQSIDGKRGDDPAGKLPPGPPGFYVVGYHSAKFEVSFDTYAEFQRYLETEGLERNLVHVAKRWKLGSKELEVYSRGAKSFVQRGAGAPFADHVFGFPLELVADTNPYTDASAFRVRLLYRGKPLDGALVVAFNKADPTHKLRVRTDKDGRAELKLARRGIWLVTSVHMIPAPFLSRTDWESFWASLTFELPNRP